MASPSEKRSALQFLWAAAIVTFLIGVAPAARRRLRQTVVEENAPIATPTQGSPHGWWMALQQQTVAADATREVSSEYVTRLPLMQQALCERFSLLCLDSNTSDNDSSSSDRTEDGSLRERVRGLGLKEMTDFALAAPFLLTSKWTAFTEMVLQLGIIRDKSLTRFSALQQRLAPFFPTENSATAAESAEAEPAPAPERKRVSPPPSPSGSPRTPSRQLSRRGRKQPAHESADLPPLPPPREYSGRTALAADAAAATAAAAAAEGTADGVDMEFVRLTWTELQDLAEEERQLASTYLALAAEQNLFNSIPDDSLWEALLQQVVNKAAAAAAAAKSGLMATFPDLYHEGTEGYQVAFAALAAADERIRLLLLQQQDTYAGSQPVLFFIRGILISLCEPGRQEMGRRRKQLQQRLQQQLQQLQQRLQPLQTYLDSSVGGSMCANLGHIGLPHQLQKRQ
ncbi:uncharacterized protein EMH_0059460 [Eimeria mitis]|uniref:Uncharacterized protein n=1 Tax=Eimeria mitis TaxID=44415 RepID=U6KF39_9EIME|nr:uncharacterized protein EMH_0059460 [Eimeria mitis]CDJ34093.1 hypothetical protein, conserved [Eimeria mitis]